MLRRAFVCEHEFFLLPAESMGLVSPFLPASSRLASRHLNKVHAESARKCISVRLYLALAMQCNLVAKCIHCVEQGTFYLSL
jgi:hypothetical protein